MILLRRIQKQEITYTIPYHGLGVVQENRVVEDDQRVSGEQMGHMGGQRGVYSRLRQLGKGVFIEIYWNIVESCQICPLFLRFRAIDEHRDRRVSALAEALSSVGGEGRIRESLDVHAVRDRSIFCKSTIVNSLRNYVPSGVCVDESAAKYRRRCGKRLEDRAEHCELVIQVARLVFVSTLHCDLQTAASHSKGHSIHVESFTAICPDRDIDVFPLSCSNIPSQSSKSRVGIYYFI